MAAMLKESDRLRSVRVLPILLGALVLPGTAARAQDLEAGKTPAQLFSSNCTACHQSPRGLARSAGAGLTGFLRQHYTTNHASAAALAAYLAAAGGPDPRQAGRRGHEQTTIQGRRSPAPEARGDEDRGRESGRRRAQEPAGANRETAKPDNKRREEPVTRRVLRAESAIEQMLRKRERYRNPPGLVGALERAGSADGPPVVSTDPDPITISQAPLPVPPPQVLPLPVAPPMPPAPPAFAGAATVATVTPPKLAVETAPQAAVVPAPPAPQSQPQSVAPPAPQAAVSVPPVSPPDPQQAMVPASAIAALALYSARTVTKGAAASPAALPLLLSPRSKTAEPLDAPKAAPEPDRAPAPGTAASDVNAQPAAPSDAPMAAAAPEPTVSPPEPTVSPEAAAASTPSGSMAGAQGAADGASEPQPVASEPSAAAEPAPAPAQADPEEKGTEATSAPALDSSPAITDKTEPTGAAIPRAEGTEKSEDKTEKEELGAVLAAPTPPAEAAAASELQPADTPARPAVQHAEVSAGKPAPAEAVPASAASQPAAEPEAGTANAAAPAGIAGPQPAFSSPLP